MPRLQLVTTNFTAGEFSPLLEGRSDLEKYNSSAKLLRNVVVHKQGGATIRPPMAFLGEVKDSNEPARLIPFVYSVTDAYVLEFGHLVMRVWRFGSLVESSPGVPFELVTPITSSEAQSMDFTTRGDTMFITVGTRYPQRLRRFADNQWDIGDAPFSPGAVAELGERPSVGISIDSTAVGAGRTLTATGAAFLAGDVGRTVTWGIGSATITAFTSTTVVTATVTSAFSAASEVSPNWSINESPMTTLTPSAASPVGASISLTLGADGWRSGNVGGLVDINGGQVRITSYTSPTVVTGTIQRELTSATAAAADAWGLLVPIWRPGDGFPRTCTFYQQRLWLGGTSRFPQSIWGSRSGLYFDFTPGTDDDSAVYKTADSDETNPLQWLCSGKSLVLLGYGAEFEGKGGIEKPATQTNMQINVESEWGSGSVRPAAAGKEIIFVERSGAVLRSVFPGQVEGLDSSDLSVFSEHLIELGIRWLTFEKRPHSVLWVGTNDGKMHAVTFNREQNTLAWASGESDGIVEWGVTIPEGDRDVTYVLVERESNGGLKRYVEKVDWLWGRGKFDSCIQTLGSGVTWPCSHLIGRTVAVVADGVYAGLKVVDGSGNITLDRPATVVSRGLPYEAKMVLRAPEVGTGTGTSQGQSMSTHSVMVRLYQSVGMKVNGHEIPFRKFDTPVLDQQVPAFTGLKELMTTGWAKGDSDIELVQDQGMPWTVLAVVRGLTVNP